MFENLDETEIIQEAETLKLLQEQQKKLDQREGREWLKFVQIARGIYLATKNHEYITIETVHQALLYTSDNKELIVTHDHDISLSSVIRIYEKQYRYQRKILGLKTKFIPNGYKLLVSLSCDFWGARAIPQLNSIDRSRVAIYTALYNEMSQHHLDSLKKRTREADEDIAFRQLIKFK